jgi:hypothetical protein
LTPTPNGLSDAITLIDQDSCGVISVI